LRETGTNLPIANIRQDPHVAAYVGLDRKPDRSAACAANPEADVGTDLRRGARPTGMRSPAGRLGSGRNTRHSATLAAEAEAEAEQRRVQESLRQGHEGQHPGREIGGQYVAEAQRLVRLLEKIRQRAALINAANFAFPNGAEPLAPGVFRCGWNGDADHPHTSIASCVRMPALGPTLATSKARLPQSMGGRP
jgi:hypothetical protein